MSDIKSECQIGDVIITFSVAPGATVDPMQAQNFLNEIVDLIVAQTTMGLSSVDEAVARALKLRTPS